MANSGYEMALRAYKGTSTYAAHLETMISSLQILAKGMQSSVLASWIPPMEAALKEAQSDISLLKKLIPELKNGVSPEARSALKARSEKLAKALYKLDYEDLEAIDHLKSPPVNTYMKHYFKISTDFPGIEDVLDELEESTLRSAMLNLLD